ncbi:hypothetical protein L6452_09311 [Arctium lappa]|uniref:Uncharacterized protein n=1 Tax=Arctium lappa TaxID=4217 RepID=A0ACB9DJQ3_ARCLA|nr:hypothetical protein L6452_09311 [Arctium lappa]
MTTEEMAKITCFKNHVYSSKGEFSNDPKEIFKFNAFIKDESETSEQSTSEASTSEDEPQSSLNPDAPLYSPFSDECLRTTFTDDIKKINQENIIADLEKKESMKRIIKVSRPKKVEKPSEVVISGKTERDFLDSDSESDPEVDEQIFYKPEKVIHKKIDTIGSGILNIPISILKIKPRIPICPDFAEMCLQAKTSLELEKELQEKAKNKTIISQLYTYKPIKFTPGQKGKWQEINHSDPVCAVSNKEKRMFLNKRRQIEKKKQSMPIWYLDSGCSRHMTGDKKLLSSFKDKSGGAVTFGDNMQGHIKGYGELTRVKMFGSGIKSSHI